MLKGLLVARGSIIDQDSLSSHEERKGSKNLSSISYLQ
jgi:hypothetical protein